MDTCLSIDNQLEIPFYNYSSPPDMFIKVALVGGFDISDYREDYKRTYYFENNSVNYTHIYRKNNHAIAFWHFVSAYKNTFHIKFLPFLLEKGLSFEGYRDLLREFGPNDIPFQLCYYYEKNWKITIKI